MADFRDDRIGSALRGENPTVLRRVAGGFAVMGDVQWLPGYCVLLCDQQGIQRLSELPALGRTAFLESMADLAEAVERACRERDPAFRRANIEILGNTDPFLHAHVWARYDWEPEAFIGGPVWKYPMERWRDPESQLGGQHDSLRQDIGRHLDAITLSRKP